MTDLKSAVCTWAQETYGDVEHNVWEPSCGNPAWVLDDGSPAENGMKFCPFCGRPLVEQPFVSEEEEP